MPTLRPILLVEDNPNDVELALTALRQANLANQVIVAYDGEEALDFLFRRRDHAQRGSADPCVVFLDLKMPGIDGREVLQQIRHSVAFARLPVVVLTSSREESDLLDTYQLGANAYVVKPVGFESFVGAVSKLGFFWALLNEPPPQTQT
jgi:CheY-like chemotaxis protein